MPNIKRMPFAILIAVFFICGVIAFQSALASERIPLNEHEKVWLKAHPTIRLGFNPDMQPLFIQDTGGGHIGVLPDIILRLEALTGLEILIEAGPWHKVIQQVKQGDIDGLLLCVPDLAEEAGLLPTKGYIDAIPVVFGKKEASVTITSIEDLQGKRVAYMRKVKFVENILNRFGNTITVVKCNSVIDAMKMVLEGKADVVLGMNFDTYLISQSVLSGVVPLFIDTSHVVKAVTAVYAEWPELVSILNKGLAAMGEADIHKILAKWTQIEAVSKPVLTESERTWLKAHPVIRVGADRAWGPIEFLDSDGNYKGLAIDYLNRIESMLGLRFEFVREGWQALIARAKEREVDLFTCVASTPERERYLLFTEPYLRMPAGIFAGKNVAYITGLNQIAGKKLSVVEGYAVHDYLSAAYPDIQLVLVKTPEEGVGAVLQEKAFAFAGNIITTGHLISHKGFLNVKMVGEIPFSNAQRMGVRKDWPELRNILQKAISAIPDAERNTMYNQWVPVTFEKGADYSLLRNVGLGCLLLVCLVFLWNRRLAVEVGRRTAAYRDSEKKLKAIFNHRFQLTGLLDVDGKVIQINKTACSMVGVDPGELTGKFFWQIPHWDHSWVLQLEIQRAVEKVKEGKPISFETTHRDVKGDIKQIEFSLTPAHDDKGTLVYIVPEGRDITEQKQSEKRLIESERNYREIYNASGDAVLIHDAETGRIIDVNQTLYEIFGYTREEALGLDIEGISSGGTRFTQKKAYEKIRKAVDEGPQLFEWFAKRKDGTCFWVEVGLRSTTIGGKGRVLAVVRDIEQRKRLDSELRLVKHSIEHNTNPFEWVQKDSRFFYVNDAACRSLGYTHEEYCSMRVSDIDPNLPSEAWPKFWEALKSGKTLTFESCHRKKNGDIFPVEITASYLEFEGQEHVFAYSKDITERKAAEDALKEKAKLRAQLVQAKKMEAVGTLAGGVAHDLNNILSGLISYPELLMMDMPDDSPLKKPLMTIKRSGDKAAAIVQDLLTLARRGVKTDQVVDLNKIVEEYLASPECDRLRSFYPGVVIETRLEKGLLAVQGSPAHFSKAVMNLVSNATEAMSGGGKVQICLENRYVDYPIGNYEQVAEGDYVAFTVSDTGVGIEAQDLERIFEPFYTKKKMGRSGTGLGMTVVWGVVKDHNGYIDVQSKPGEGSRFTLYFPATRVVDEASERETFGLGRYTGNGKFVLIVDDSSEQREIAAGILEKIGYRSASVPSGEAAVEYLKNNKVDMLLLDMIMDPGINGLETYKRAIEICPGLKAMIASGFSKSDHVREALQLGAGGYLKKPYTMASLAKAVKKELGR